MLGEMKLFAEFAKIDEEQRTVFGWASTETRDQQGEIVRREAIEAALPAYLKYPAVREMHQPSAVGKAIETDMREPGLWFGAKVVDDRAWAKVKSGVYRGFSIGGRVTSRDPVDPSIIDGLDLTEVSLVDRPANPDAAFVLVKRAGAHLLPQPQQVWYCGDGNHQHVSKDEAAGCMTKRLTEIETNIERIEKARSDDTGRFSSNAGLAAEALDKAKMHDELARRAKLSADRHRRHVERAKKSGDQTAITIHDQLAQRNDQLADHHKQTADNYRNLAAQQQPSQKENAMTTQSTADIVKEAADAVALLANALNTDKPATVIAKAADPHSLHLMGVEADDAATNAMVAAEEEKMRAGALRADGKNDEADHADANAAAQMTAAQHHAAAAASYHHMTEVAMSNKPADSAHGANEDNVTSAGDTSKADGSVHGENEDEWTQKVKDMEQYHKLMAKNFANSEAQQTAKGDAAKKAANENAANFHYGVARQMHDMGTKHAAHADAYAKMLNTKLAAESAKVVEKSALKLAKDLTWVQKADGSGFFGKREFSDKQRQSLADEGKAMPDGSFPIENKKDLQNAVHAIGRAKDRSKAMAHIKARAKALGATDALPDSWGKADTSAPQDVQCPHCQEMNKAGAKECCKCGKSMAVAKTDQPEAVTPCPHCKEMNKADAKECCKCGKSMTVSKNDTASTSDVSNNTKETPQHETDAKPGEIVASLDNEAQIDPNTAKVDLGKGMGLIGQIANILANLESLAESSAIEQLMEGDKDDDTADKIETWLSAGVDLLREIVTNETAELLAGTDVEAPLALAAASAYTAISKVGPWHKSVAKAIRATVTKDMAPAERIKRKALAEKIDALVPSLAKADEKHLGELRASLTKAGLVMDVAKTSQESQAQLAAVTSERDTVSKTLATLTKTLTPLARSVQELRKKQADSDAENAALKEKIEKLEKQPLPGKGRVVSGTISKVDDTGAGGGDKPGVLENLAALPPGADRAKAILKLAHDMRS